MRPVVALRLNPAGKPLAANERGAFKAPHTEGGLDYGKSRIRTETIRQDILRLSGDCLTSTLSRRPHWPLEYF